MLSFKSLVTNFSALDTRVRKRLFLAVLAVVCVAAWLLTTPAQEAVVALPKPSETKGELVIEPESIFVHVAGAVKHPGVYSAPQGFAHLRADSPGRRFRHQGRPIERQPR